MEFNSGFKGLITKVWMLLHYYTCCDCKFEL